MKLINKICAMLLILSLFVNSTEQGFHAFAAEITAPKVTVLHNDFIKVTVDNATGRFGIRTLEGQPIRKKDQNVNMLFQGDDPETSFTTFRIDGTDYIFGNPYKFGVNFFSETSAPQVVEYPNSTKAIQTTWKIKGVEITQILMLYTDAKDKINSGNVNIRYEVKNNSGVEVALGSRILLDTMVAGNDGPEFQIGTAYKAPLTVERKLVHDPGAIGIPLEDQAFYKLPAYWVMRDQLDLSNPLATNVTAYGFNNIAEGGINIVDEMIVGHWNSMANTKWDYTPNPNLDFTKDTNDFGTADSAVAFYWQPKSIAALATKTFETVYGLGELIAPDKIFSIRFIDPVQQLGTVADKSAYENDGVFDVTAEVENLAMFDMEHSEINVEMTLESGLNFVKLNDQGEIMLDGNGKPLSEAYRSKSLPFKKTATPEEADLGINPTYKPGDTITTSFKVIAKGKAWPTTKEYMLTAKSPETQAKIEGIKDEGIIAQYESSKANFVLLPAIGTPVPTFVYAMTPKELFSTDVKYIKVNLSNIEAYNLGNETTAPNFDLYLKEKITGKRYKVDVKKSVIIQSTDDGLTGEMRITYRGGDQVNGAGDIIQADLGPELPFGEYQVQLDYKMESGGDVEVAALFDITTTQSFLVTANEATRIREASIMAVYKQYVDLSHVTTSMSGPALELINSSYPGKPFANGTNLFNALAGYKAAKTIVGIASNATDPKFRLDDYLDNVSLKTVAAYQYKLFASEKDYNDFFDKEDFPNREMLVVVRGMIKQVGTGSEQQIIVDTKTEPAIINDSVAYQGKDMVFVKGQLDVFGLPQKVSGYNTMPFFDTLFMKGDGTLSVAGSGFIFYKGEWTLDFYNGFDKKLGDAYVRNDEVFPSNQENEEDNSLNGSLKWAVGTLGDRLNPIRQLMVSNVYFNRHSLFAPPSFQVSGFGLSFNDFILRPGGISFGGSIALKIVNAEMRNVVFNSKGFVGMDASLKFDLDKNIGLFDKKEKGGTNGEIYISHYEQPVAGIENRYGIKFQADLKSIEIQAELGFKKVKDGRILPDVIAFGTTLPKPGVMITGATYLTAVRGALRELADTIAGGTSKDPFPLVIQAGVSLKFGVAPAYFFGDVDLTVKRTGMKVMGKLDFSVDPDGEDRMNMITQALLESQWVTPWFVRLATEIDIGGWGVIIGKAGIFVGQNLEKNRIDFEGYIGAAVKIPNSVPIVGGLPLASVFLGVNNEKLWGNFSVLFISMGITYYWGGGLEFGTANENVPDGFIQLVVNDPEHGPRLMVIGQGVETVATSWVDAEQDKQGVIYRELNEGVKVVENGANNVGIGGIVVKNSGRVHEIPVGNTAGNAMIEVEYDSKVMPSFTLKDSVGKAYPIVFDNTNTNPAANAFTQFIAAKDAADQVDLRKAYVIIPEDKVVKGETWTLTSLSSVRTRLLSIPTTPELKQVNLDNSTTDINKFTASWQVANAKVGDTVSLYLTKDAVTTDKSKLKGIDVLEPGEPGLLIAKDLPVNSNGGVSGKLTKGSTDIDVTHVGLLGDTEDIRGLLAQGDYYLRAELKSYSAFGTKTSAEKFKIIDPLAPTEVSDVSITPAGNGKFSLSFKRAAKKAGHEGYESSFVIQAQRELAGKMQAYPNFEEMMFSEEELAPYWNAATQKYEGILIGGWSAMTTTDEISDKSLTGTVLNKDTKVNYTGLEVGYEYIIGVSSVTKPPKATDKNENYHYAGRVDTAKRLLPPPVKPDLRATVELGSIGTSPDFIELLTKATEQTINLASSQSDVEVEAIYADNSIGKVKLTNNGKGNQGSLTFSQFKTDGPYAIELKATNTKTGDISVTMLYLTVDTLAPILYINQPVTGERTKNGSIVVSGTTTNDAKLWVNNTELAVQQDGKFTGTVSVDSSDDPTAELRILARDGAGNENVASIMVTSDRFKLPVALIVREMAAIKPGESTSLVAVLRVADGKDGQKKPKFKEVAIPANDLSKLSFAVKTGDAISLTDTGRVTGLEVGASLIEASYEVAPGVTLQAMAVAAVKIPAQKAIRTLAATTSSISGITNKTKVSVDAAENLEGQQLVYKVYSTGTNVVLPTFKQDLSSWDFLPTNGELAVSAGSVIVVAARTSLDKLALGAAKLYPTLWVSSAPSTNPPSGGDPGGSSPGVPGVPGIPGGFIPGGVPADMTVDDQKIEIEQKSNVAVVHISSKDVNASGSKAIVVASKDKTITDYTFHFDPELVGQALSNQKVIRIDLPFAKFELTAAQLTGMKEELVLHVTHNSTAGLSSSNAITESLKAELVGGGAGVTITSNLPEASWSASIPAKIALPDSIKAGEFTAVLLKAENGKWTTVPWKLDADGISVNLQLTGEGSLIFVRSTPSFSDIANNFWGKQSIDAAAAKLFVLGKGDKQFDAQSKITRAEYPTILLRVAGLMNKSAEASFSDVNSTNWFNQSVAIAAKLGIVNGLSDGSYAPQAPMSRVEAMAMVGRLLTVLGIGEEMNEAEVTRILSGYSDKALIPDWARKSVAATIKNGIILGENKQVHPQDVLTRAQAAAIAMRLDQLITSK